jgi:hypothetical protein
MVDMINKKKLEGVIPALILPFKKMERLILNYWKSRFLTLFLQG